jgi:hypothetical protein
MVLEHPQGVFSMWSCTVKLDEEKSKHAGLAHVMVLSMWSYTAKLDEEKSKHAGLAHVKMVLAQHNCTVCLLWLVKGVLFCTCWKECNEYDLTAAQCLWLRLS